MALGSTHVTRIPLSRETSSLWQAVATALRRWTRRREIARPVMSEEWLRQHEIESSKHRDGF
jgi:uncharacterized protein (DUF2384 family)